MTAQIGADGLDLLGDPCLELLTEVALVQPESGLFTSTEECPVYACRENYLAAEASAGASSVATTQIAELGSRLVAMAHRSGKSYELQVMRYLVQQRRRVAFKWDAQVPAGSGGRERQIDIWLPDTREIIECKHHTARVDVGVVDRMVGTVRDVNASAARIFSSSGFTQGALDRAQKEPIECVPLPFASRFEEPFPATGGGCYLGDFVEECLCSVPSDMACDYGRVNYIDRDEALWPICTSVSVDWKDIEAHRFIAYLLLAHVLLQPPSDASISELVACYGDRFESGQEWSVTEDEVRRLAWAELAPSYLGGESRTERR